MVFHKKHTFWDLGYQCNLLQHACNMKLKPEIRRFYEAMHLVQQLHDIKWWVFALFLTLYLEFQLEAWYPGISDAQIKANISAVFMMGMFVVIYATQRGIMYRTVCPVELNALLNPTEKESIQKVFLDSLPSPPDQTLTTGELSKMMLENCISNSQTDKSRVPQDMRGLLSPVTNISNRILLRPLTASDLGVYRH